MARPLRIEFPAAIYHVSVRMLGNWKNESNLLFEDDADRTRLLHQLGERVQLFDIRLYLVTLMANHFHLVAETPAGNLGRFMQSLCTAYSVYFNLRHRRHGHLFDGRYKAKLVEGDPYLLALTRYIHLNPVHTEAMKLRPLQERINHLRRYRWSSYPGYIGLRNQFDFIDAAPILAQMNCAKRDRAGCYRQYVESGIAANDEEFMEVMKGSPFCIGTAPFRRKIAKQYEAEAQSRDKLDDVSFRRRLRTLETEKVLAVLAEVFGVGVDDFLRRRRNSPLRGLAARALCHYAGLTQRQASAVPLVGSGSGVSCQLRKLDQWLQTDRKLATLVQAAELALNQLRDITTTDLCLGKAHKMDISLGISRNR